MKLKGNQLLHQKKNKIKIKKEIPLILHGLTRLIMKRIKETSN